MTTANPLLCAICDAETERANSLCESHHKDLGLPVRLPKIGIILLLRQCHQARQAGAMAIRIEPPK